CAHIENVLPRLTAVVGCRHDCVRTTDSTASHCTTRHREVDTTVTVDPNGWILKIGVSAGLTRCVLNRAYVPRQAVVFRDYNGPGPGDQPAEVGCPNASKPSVSVNETLHEGDVKVSSPAKTRPVSRSVKPIGSESTNKDVGAELLYQVAF